MHAFSAVLVAAVLPGVSLAQSATIAGTVVDSGGRGVAAVEVTLTDVHRVTRTSYQGEFIFKDVAPGAYTVIFRRVGYAPRTDTVSVKAGEVKDDEFTLTQSAVTLDSQVVTAAPAATTSPYLRDFEARRKTNPGGHFFDQADLDKMQGANLMRNLISRIPAMHLFQPDPVNRPSDYYPASGRFPNLYPQYRGNCPVAIFIDGVALYIPAVTLGELPDISTLTADQFAAVEYYSSGATVPSQYNVTQLNCGVFLLWRRYR